MIWEIAKNVVESFVGITVVGGEKVIMNAIIAKKFLDKIQTCDTIQNMNKLTVTIVTAALMFMGVGDLQSKGFKSSSRSFSSSKSFKSSPTRSYKPSSRPKPKVVAPKSPTKAPSVKPTSTKPSSSKSVVTQKYKSATDQKQYQAAVKSGKAFKTRDAAVADFKKTSATKYSSTYPKKPSTRPAHIPEKTTVNGKSYDVTYDQSRGGYGYMGSSGWSAYDTMRDVAMVSMLMNNNGYYVGSPYQPAIAPAPAVYHQRSNYTGLIIGMIVLFVVLGGLGLVISRA